MEHNEQIIRITQKLQQLLGRHELLIKENEKLKRDNEVLKLTKEAQTARLLEMEQTVAVLKTLAGKIEPEEKKELEKKIGNYLKEIDRCISLLGQ
jgi:hypothetical protein